jgi:hypothetical protein
MRADSSSVLMNCPPSPAVRVVASIRPARETSIHSGMAPLPLKIVRKRGATAPGYPLQTEVVCCRS